METQYYNPGSEIELTCIIRNRSHWSTKTLWLKDQQLLDLNHRPTVRYIYGDYKKNNFQQIFWQQNYFNPYFMEVHRGIFFLWKKSENCNLKKINLNMFRPLPKLKWLLVTTKPRTSIFFWRTVLHELEVVDLIAKLWENYIKLVKFNLVWWVYPSYGRKIEKETDVLGLTVLQV